MSSDLRASVALVIHVVSKELQLLMGSFKLEVMKILKINLKKWG